MVNYFHDKTLLFCFVFRRVTPPEGSRRKRGTSENSLGSPRGTATCLVRDTLTRSVVS